MIKHFGNFSRLWHIFSRCQLFRKVFLSTFKSVHLVDTKKLWHDIEWNCWQLFHGHILCPFLKSAISGGLGFWSRYTKHIDKKEKNVNKIPIDFASIFHSHQLSFKMNNFLDILVLAFLSSVALSGLPSELPSGALQAWVCIHRCYKLLIHGNIFRFLVVDGNNFPDIQSSLNFRKCIRGHYNMRIVRIHVLYPCKSQSVLFLFIGFPVFSTKNSKILKVWNFWRLEQIKILKVVRKLS